MGHWISGFPVARCPALWWNPCGSAHDPLSPSLPLSVNELFIWKVSRFEKRRINKELLHYVIASPSCLTTDTAVVHLSQMTVTTDGRLHSTPPFIRLSLVNSVALPSCSGSEPGLRVACTGRLRVRVYSVFLHPHSCLCVPVLPAPWPVPC